MPWNSVIDGDGETIADACSISREQNTWVTQTRRHEHAAVPVASASRPAIYRVSPERARSILACWAGPAVPVVFLAIMGFRQRWVAEDAFISLRVVDQLLAGNGPVFNRGERVEAYTHPLWVAILTIWGVPGWSTAWGSVILGIVFSIAGLIAALAAASRLSDRLLWLTTEDDGTSLMTGRRESSGAIAIPVGAIVFVSLPVVWDFVTSGLETGLSFGWLGCSFWLLVRVGFDEVKPSRISTLSIVSAVVIGLGPLVRPDLAIYSAGFLLSLIACSNRASFAGNLRRTILLGAAASALPLLYQLFRMGYFAALVPNTALAKEASDARWSQGWIYLLDFTGTYQLWLPLLLTAGFWALLARRAWNNLDRPALIVMIAPVASAALHVLYVVRVGGDFMHGRFLLPALFGLLLPVMLVRVPLVQRPRTHAVVSGAALLVLAGWSIVAACWLRVPYAGSIGDDGIADERGVYVLNARHPNPITLDDYKDMSQSWPRDGLVWRELARDRARVLIVDGVQYPLDPSTESKTDVVVLAWNVGIAGFAAGVDVHVSDGYGLSDPIASRLRLTERGRPGHEKQLDPAWAIARFSSADGSAEDATEVDTARTALGCRDIDHLLDAIDEPLTAGRFIDNLFLSWSLRNLRIPNDPETAVDELC